MKDTVEILSKVLPVILLIILGGFLRKARFIGQNTIGEFKKIIVNITLPATLFLTFAKTTFESRYIMIFISVFLVCIIMLLLGTVLKKQLKHSNKYYPAIFSGFETGMMGYSLYAVVYGTANVYKLALIDLGQVVFVFFVLVSYLQKLNGRSANAKELTLSFIKSPVILSIILGITVSFTGDFSSISSPVVNSIFETLRLLSEMTMPIICIAIGYELKINLKGIGGPLLATVIRMVLLLGMAYAINELVIDRLLNLDDTFKIALYTMFLLPPPFVIPIYMNEKEEKNKQFILNTLSISIILSLLAFIVLILTGTRTL
ncbi:MAG: permease [Clostridiaceae bacterium]|jgi:predicted permease|nr:permease [Clostridiaceae bacterium]